MTLMKKLAYWVTNKPYTVEYAINHASENKSPLNIEFKPTVIIIPSTCDTSMGIIHSDYITSAKLTNKISISVPMRNGKEHNFFTYNSKPTTYHDIDSKEAKIKIKIEKLKFLQTIYGIVQDAQQKNIDLMIQGEKHTIPNISIFDELLNTHSNDETYHELITTNPNHYDVLDEIKLKKHPIGDVLNALSEIQLEN